MLLFLIPVLAMVLVVYKEDVYMPDANENGWVTHAGNDRSDDDTLISVNALDGSIIDMAHGY